MSKQDILKIETDIGLCTDTLMAIFLYFCVNTKIGIIYFFLSLIVEAILYRYEVKKISKLDLEEQNNE